MSKLGGYLLLDFKGVQFTSGVAKPTSVSGLKMYDRIESTNKRIVVSGLVVGNIEYDDFEVLFAVSGTSFVARHGYTSNAVIQITVTEEDTITVTIG